MDLVKALGLVWVVIMKHASFRLGLVLLMMAAGTSCSRTAAPVNVAAASPATLPAPVSSTSVAASTDTYTATGPIVVENQVDVAAQREGVVTEILVEPGTRVHKGQLLARLDDRQLAADLEAGKAKTASIEADLNNWKAEAKVLEADYERARKMWEAKIITQEQLEHARFKAEADQWDVQRVGHLLVNAQDTEKSLELELEKTQIVAPFDGVVARRYVRAGQTVTQDERLFWVTATAPLRVRFTLPSKFLHWIKVGDAVKVTASDASPGFEHSARVIQMSPVVDPASGSVEILAEFSGSVSDLRPGMQAEVHLAKP